MSSESSKIAADVASRKLRNELRAKYQASLIEVSLWNNGVKYEYGMLCKFCTKETAQVSFDLCFVCYKSIN